MMRRLGLVAAGSAMLALAGCDEPSEPAQAQQPPPPPAVTVSEVASRPLSETASFVGRAEAVDTVELRARVTGFLERRLFDEGQDVRAGDLLMVIEKAPFEAAVAQARAGVARADADALNARQQLQRAQDLAGNRNIPEATVDEREAQAASTQAQLLSAQAALRVAEIDLGYTDISAPIDGRIGEAVYAVGNLVGPDRGVLATIVTQDPIHIRFPVSSRELLQARRDAAERGLDPDNFTVQAKLPDGTAYPHPGRVDFLDIRVDRSTDTRIVRATFPNPERLLVDGQFLDIVVEEVRPEQALTVPQAALQFTQQGASVLVVGNDDKVEQRQVTAGRMVGGDVVIAQGLEAGERVIVEGIQSVRPGQTVAPATAETAAARG